MEKTARYEQSIESIWNCSLLKLVKYKHLQIIYCCIIIWTQIKILFYIYRKPVRRIMEELILFMVDSVEPISIYKGKTFVIPKYAAYNFTKNDTSYASVTVGSTDKLEIWRDKGRIKEYSFRFFDDNNNAYILLRYDNEINSMYCICETPDKRVDINYGEKLKTVDNYLYKKITRSFRKRAFQIAADSDIILDRRLKQSKTLYNRISF